MTDCLIIIPARYKSTRLPGKPLRKICGKTMLQRVHDRCVSTGLDTIVATDDFQIKKECILNHMEVIMTSPNCLTGTDRVAEVLTKKGISYSTKNVSKVNFASNCNFASNYTNANIINNNNRLLITRKKI